MATGPEHYSEAETALELAATDNSAGNHSDAEFWQREAQVRATLAQAAAVAMAAKDHMPAVDWAAWDKVSGVPQEH